MDKRFSVKHKRRVPENTLLSVAFFGGTIGSVLGIIIFRHKISKTSFLLKFGIIILIQVTLIYILENIFGINYLISLMFPGYFFQKFYNILYFRGLNAKLF